MAKIVIIGAGSHVFSRHLITDILTWPELRDGTISLMDISQEPLDLIAGFARRLVKQNGFKTKIEATTKRREALDGADYVFVTIQVGGSKATWPDRELPGNTAWTRPSAILPGSAGFSTAPVMCPSFWTSAAIWQNSAPTPGC